MRRLACWSVLLAGMGCELAPAAPEPTPLATVTGDVVPFDTNELAEVRDTLMDNDVEDPTLHLVLSWFRRGNATQGVPPWIPAEMTGLEEGGQFQLPVLRAPPADALFTTEEARSVAGEEQQGQFALGVLSLAVAGDPFDWAAVVADPPTARIVRYELGTVVVYWAGPEPFIVAGSDGDVVTIPRGLSRLESLPGGVSEQIYASRSASDARLTDWDGLPEWAFCAPQSDTTPELRSVDDVDDWPDPGTVDCWSCDGVETFETRCRQVLGVLCEQCLRVRVEAALDELIGVDWPCLPEGRPCPIEEEAFCRADGRRFECIEGVWQQTGSGDCFNECDG